jgi:uncharacterized membrane protein
MHTWQELVISFVVPLGLFFAAVWLVGIKPIESESEPEDVQGAWTWKDVVQSVTILALVATYLWALRSEFSIVATVMGCLFLGYYYAHSLWKQLKACGFDDLPQKRKLAPVIVGLLGTATFVVWSYYLQTLALARA